MRTFRFFYDDTLRELPRHDSGYLVGRKPMVTGFTKPKTHKGRTAASTRMGVLFLKKLAKLGL